MFGILNDLAKAAVAVVSVPVALVTDTAEVVGLAHDSGRNHTGEALKNIVDNIEKAATPDR